jgi:hypothetical protein
MLKVLLSEKWRDDVPVYKFFTGAEAKKYHQFLNSDFRGGKTSVKLHEEKLADLEKPGRQKGLHEFRAIKNAKAGLTRAKRKRDAAKFRIDKIEAAIKDWFAI